MEPCSSMLRVVVTVLCSCLCLQHHSRVLAITEVKMQDNCNREISMIYKSIYQGRLVLTTQRSFDLTKYSSSDDSICDTHIESWYSAKKIMFYFESLNLNCNYGYLQFYDGTQDSTGSSTLIPGLSEELCGTTKPSGIFLTESRDLRVRYVSKQRATITNVVKIIFTSYRDDTCPSYDHECANGRCIDNDLACNGFNSCGDNSSCDLSKGTIAGIVIGCLLAVLAIIACVICIRCAKRRPGRSGACQQPVQYTQPNQPGVQQPVQYMHPPTMVAGQSTVPGTYPMQSTYPVMPQGPAYGAPMQGAPMQGMAQYGAPAPGTAQYGVTTTTAPTQYGVPAPGMAPTNAAPPPAYDTLYTSENQPNQTKSESAPSAPPADY